MKVRDFIAELDKFDGNMDLVFENGKRAYVYQSYRGDSRWVVVIADHPKGRND